MTQEDLKLLWYQALAEPIGLLLAIPPADINRSKQALYRARADTKDPDLDAVQIRSSKIEEGQLVMVKETVQVPAAPTNERAEEL